MDMFLNQARERRKREERERWEREKEEEKWWRQNLGTITELKSKVTEEKQVRKGDKKSRVRKDEGWEEDWVKTTEREGEKDEMMKKESERWREKEREREVMRHLDLVSFVLQPQVDRSISW